jgi:hypothetical protein
VAYSRGRRAGICYWGSVSKLIDTDARNMTKETLQFGANRSGRRTYAGQFDAAVTAFWWRAALLDVEVSEGATRGL